MLIDIITIFPEMMNGFLNESMLKRASQNGLVKFRKINPRDFVKDRHKTIDCRPYGGGPGMVMMVEPLFRAIESVREEHSLVILMTPRGASFTQTKAEKMICQKHIIFICGHYEGIDERICEALVVDEISIGDYILTNGVIPAAVVIDSVVRLIPGVLGGEGALQQESFSDGLLEYPQYTRPPQFRNLKVPSVLLSGDHRAIADWREKQARKRTIKQRPDLFED